MKIPSIFLSKETVMIYFAFIAAVKHLYVGFKDLSICIVLLILLIPIFILELLKDTFKKLKGGK